MPLGTRDIPSRSLFPEPGYEVELAAENSLGIFDRMFLSGVHG